MCLGKLSQLSMMTLDLDSILIIGMYQEGSRTELNMGGSKTKTVDTLIRWYRQSTHKVKRRQNENDQIQSRRYVR